MTESSSNGDLLNTDEVYVGTEFAELWQVFFNHPTFFDHPELKLLTAEYNVAK